MSDIINIAVHLFSTVTMNVCRGNNNDNKSKQYEKKHQFIS